MELQDKVRQYKDRLRIFLILSFFADDCNDPANPSYKKLFKSETRIQKIDFLVRNPDYLSYELLNIAKVDANKKDEMRQVVKDIFDTQEPVIRRLEMERFFLALMKI